MNLNKTLSWAFVILWMALIFYLSHQPATESSELSTGMSEMILSAVNNIIPTLDVDVSLFNYIVRKGAHFTAYFVLAILSVNALRRSGITRYRSAIVALGISVLYAISDEVHQLFIPGRSGEVTDVLIDSAGASLGIAMYIVVLRVVGYLRRRNNN